MAKCDQLSSLPSKGLIENSAFGVVITSWSGRVRENKPVDISG